MTEALQLMPVGSKWQLSDVAGRVRRARIREQDCHFDQPGIN